MSLLQCSDEPASLSFDACLQPVPGLYALGSTLLECCGGQLDYQSTQQHKITQAHAA